jgi:hypothetical protein
MHAHWEVVETATWVDEGLSKFIASGRVISKIIWDDLKRCRVQNIKSALSRICMTWNGSTVFNTDYSSMNAQRNALVDTITKVHKSYYSNITGDPDIEDGLDTSILGYVLLMLAVMDITKGLEPQYFRDSTPKWNWCEWEDEGDTMEIYVTAKHTHHTLQMFTSFFM